MVDAELGTKRTCPSCAGRFYDLKADPITCPLCEETFVIEPILPSKADAPAPAPVPEPPKPAAAKPAEEEDETDDDEVAAIKDVDLGDDEDDDEAIGSDDDNTFLETDDDDDNVTDIVAPKPGDDEET